jgi:hypothetical protein
MLLGRKALRGFVIDPQKKYLCGAPKDRPKRKEASE